MGKNSENRALTMRSVFSNAEALERLFTLARSFFLVARSETFSVRFGARCFKVLASSGSKKNKKNCSKSQESLGKCISDLIVRYRCSKLVRYWFRMDRSEEEKFGMGMG